MVAHVLSVLCLAAVSAADGPGPLFPVVQGGRWGYVDRAGAVVIPPRFDAARRFSEGLASVRIGETLAYVDTRGETVLVPDLEPAGGTLHRPFSNGLAAVRRGQRIGFVDRAGRLAIPLEYLGAEDFSEGLALVCSEKGCGFVDPAGKLRGSRMWMGGTSFKNGHASVYLAMAMGRKRTTLVTSRGGVVPGEWEGSGGFSEGVAPVRFGGKWGYVDPAGRSVIPNRFADAGDFSEGLAPVTLVETDRCGYIDRAGRLRIAARFAACHGFSDGRARVDLADSPEQGERVAFVDRTGALVIVGARADPPFLDAADFTDGLAAVGVGGPIAEAENGAASLGYIDTAGRYVWPPSR